MEKKDSSQNTKQNRKIIQKNTIVLEKYKIISRLGKGSFGMVYQVQDIQEDKQYALKCMYWEQEKSQFYEKLFNRELESYKNLDHEGIVQMIEGNLVENMDFQGYFVLELCKEGNLSQLCKQKQMDEYSSLNFLSQLSEALKYISDKGYVHRDIKPLNIFIKDGKLKLGDFGFARDLPVDPQDTKKITPNLGTPYYMSPQIINRENYTNLTDIYSLGATFYEMLKGNQLNKKLKIQDQIEQDKQLDPEIKALLQQMLQEEEKDRISINEIIQKLPNIQQQISQQQPQLYQNESINNSEISNNQSKTTQDTLNVQTTQYQEQNSQVITLNSQITYQFDQSNIENESDFSLTNNQENQNSQQ